MILKAQQPLDPTQLDDARRALLSSSSDELIDLIYTLNLHRRAKKIRQSTLSMAARLGWTDSETSSLTPLGLLVADPIREYRFWLDRGRQLHTEGIHPHISVKHYRDKAVLEIGSGFGCNLLSWSQVDGRFVGVEPVELYRQFTNIFAKREGLSAPQVVEGSAEELPFTDQEFDMVVFLSVHQYTDIKVALKEAARVLRPGGQMQIVGGTISSFIGTAARQFLHHPSLGDFKWNVMTGLNTVAYQMIGRRLYVSREAGPTASPIYPSYARMQKWVSDVGLIVREDMKLRVGADTCLIADKSANKN